MAAASLALTLVVFSATITDSFLADDFNIVQSVRDQGALARYSSAGEPFFRPLVSLFYFLDLQLWGLNPKGFHLTNLLLHALNAVLVAVVAARVVGSVAQLGTSAQREIALASGLLFLLHPSHMEPIAWIAGRADLLVTVLALACIASHLRWRATGKGGWRLASLLALVAAFCAKESAIVVPLVLLALDALTTGGGWRRRARYSLRGTAPHLAVLPVFFVLRWATLGTAIGGRGATVHLNVNPPLLLDHLFHHFSRSLIPRIDGTQLPAGTVALLAVALATWFLRRRQKGSQIGLLTLLATAALCFTMAELPTLNLVVSRLTSRGERILYFPSAFTALLAAGLIYLLLHRPVLRRLVVAAVATVFSLQLTLYSQPWRDAAAACNTIRDATLEAETEGDLYLVAVPDNVGGAFAFQGGLHASLGLSGRNDLRPVIVNYVELPELNWEVSVVRRDRQLTILNEQPHRLFRLRARRFQSRKVSTVVKERNWQKMSLPSLSSRDRVLVFSQGRMIEVLP